jgi:hypothetical protein
MLPNCVVQVLVNIMLIIVLLPSVVFLAVKSSHAAL